MDQLLEIHNVPVKVEIVVTHAKINISSQPASFNLTRDRGSLSIEHSYPKLHIDSSAARSSMNLKNPLELTRDFAQRGVQAAQEATARTAEQRHALIATQNKGSEPICDFARDRLRQTADLIPAAIPSVPSQISWEPQQLKIQYEKDRLNFDWRMNRPKIDFVPGKVEFRIKQYPKTEIKYIGKPHYVPPSADPEYEGNEQNGQDENSRFEATA